MITLKELEKRVLGGENLYTEFKHKINFPEKIAREIVAFANTKGGQLFVGIDDNKTIFGLKNADEEVFALKNVIKKFIKFDINYSISTIKINEKKAVLLVDIQENSQKPNYAYAYENQKNAIAYMRVADKSVQASQVVIKILELQSKDTQIRLNFGDMQRKIVAQIDSNGYVTVKSLAEKELISIHTASEKLIEMVLAGFLKVIPEEEKDDRFVLKG